MTIEASAVQKLLDQAYELRNKASDDRNIDFENFYRGQICVLRNLLMTDEQKDAIKKKAERQTRQLGQHNLIEQVLLSFPVKSNYFEQTYPDDSQ